MRHVPRSLLSFVFLLALVVGNTAPALAQQVASPIPTDSPVTLSSINVVDGVCADGVFSIGSISVATETEGVTYEVVQPDAEGNYSVIAHLQPGYAFPDLTGSPWKLHETIPNAVIYAGQLTVTGCEQGPTAQASPTGEVAESSPQPQMMRSMRLMAAPTAASCGSAPYAAPTGTQVPAGTVSIDSVAFNYDGTTYGPGDTIPLESVWDFMELQMEWSVSGSPQPGDYFVYEGPVITNPDGTTSRAFYSYDQWFPITDGTDGPIIACASVVGGVATIVFTDYVTGKENIAGDFWLDVRMSETSSTQEHTVTVEFSDTASIQIQVPANEGPGEPDQYFWKGGWFNFADQAVNPENLVNALTWEVKLPSSPKGYKEFRVQDIGPEDGSWYFSCSGGPWGNHWYTITANDGTDTPPAIVPTLATCTDESNMVNITLEDVPADTEIFIRLYASVSTYDDGAPIPGPYENTVHAWADNEELEAVSGKIVQQAGGGSGTGDSRRGQLEITKTPSVTRVTEVGQQITYTFTVSNTGPVRVNNIKVVDQQLTDLGLNIECQTDTLAPGEETTCTSSAYSVTQADIDARTPILNVAYATGENPATTPVPTPSATSTVEVIVTPSPAPSETPSPTATAPAPTASPASPSTPQPTATSVPPTVAPTTGAQPTATQASVTGLPSTGTTGGSGSAQTILMLVGAAGIALLAAGIYRKRDA